jgi:wyosine [tRNA(Phe)-imidazoG37] synthetase (radical SAM superfamily)
MQVERQEFYKPAEILRAVHDKVTKTIGSRETIDYLTFVPDGEPSLDVNLGSAIAQLKPLGIRVAVITNSSLIWRQDVREDLLGADWVSLKVDAVEEQIWRQVDRPQGRLKLDCILEGMRKFAKVYEGELVTETMLVAGVNDGDEHLKAAADFIAHLEPSAAYLAIPTRPPAEEWASAPDEATLNRAYQILSEKVERAEYLIGYEGDAFAFTGDVDEDLLSITAVHPMREDAVSAFLERAGAEWALIHQLVKEDKLIEAEYGGHKFYIRKLGKRIGDLESSS